MQPFVCFPSEKYYPASRLECFLHFSSSPISYLSLFIFDATRRWQAVRSKFFKWLTHRRVHRTHNYPKHFANALPHKWKTCEVSLRLRSMLARVPEDGKRNARGNIDRVASRENISPRVNSRSCLRGYRIAASSNAHTVVPVVSVGGSVSVPSSRPFSCRYTRHIIPLRVRRAGSPARSRNCGARDYIIIYKTELSSDRVRFAAG